MQLRSATNVIQEDFSKLEQLISSISTKCDQSLGEADMNKVAINKNTEQIECLKLKAFKNDKSFEDMEVIKKWISPLTSKNLVSIINLGGKEGGRH